MQVNRSNLLIIVFVFICIILMNVDKVLVLTRDLVLGLLLGDIPAPPSYAIKYTGYGSGWVLTYDTELTEAALMEYYLKELPNQNWDIQHYLASTHDCIFAERNGVIRVIEIGGSPRYKSSVYVRFEDAFCDFANPP